MLFYFMRADRFTFDSKAKTNFQISGINYKTLVSYEVARVKGMVSDKCNITLTKRVSSECSKTKTKVITLTNYTQTARMSVTGAKRGKTRASKSRLVSVSLLTG